MTVNTHEAVLPAASVAVAETAVVPKGKRLPDGGDATTTGEASQASIAVTAKRTLAPPVAARQAACS